MGGIGGLGGGTGGCGGKGGWGGIGGIMLGGMPSLPLGLDGWLIWSFGSFWLPAGHVWTIWSPNKSKQTLKIIAVWNLTPFIQFIFRNYIGLLMCCLHIILIVRRYIWEMLNWTSKLEQNLQSNRNCCCSFWPNLQTPIGVKHNFYKLAILPQSKCLILLAVLSFLCWLYRPYSKKPLLCRLSQSDENAFLFSRLCSLLFFQSSLILLVGVV